MPDVRPFQAWRYDLGRVGRLSDVVAPPYDVIDPALQEALYQRHPANVVRLELPRGEPQDASDLDRYARAGKLLRQWQQEGILRQDPHPAVYVCHQTFTLDGTSYTRRGVLARVRLEPFGSGRIFPHEETLPAPKADRLHLLRATGMNLSPIFGLYPDPDRTVQDLLDQAVLRQPPLEAEDHLGVVSRLWPLVDLHRIAEVQRLLYPRPVFLADGHHRYETALKYREERIAAGEAADDADPAHFVLMMLVGMSDPGLVILPTHRLVRNLPPLDSASLRRILDQHFDVEAIGSGREAGGFAWDLIHSEGSQAAIGLGSSADGVWLVARLRRAEVMEQLAPQRSPAWRGLAVSVVHLLVLDTLLRQACSCQPLCDYVHRLDEVLESLEHKQCQVGVLVPPVGITHLEQIAGGGERMPPKSTYFYPKLLTGLVFNPVR
jgi:uncharacterized protein (DUF1015 family)